jgi:hypothetical protein
MSAETPNPVANITQDRIFRHATMCILLLVIMPRASILNFQEISPGSVANTIMRRTAKPKPPNSAHIIWRKLGLYTSRCDSTLTGNNFHGPNLLFLLIDTLCAKIAHL